MTQYVIKCGCGRTMAADGRVGRGAYRCGCGTRLQIEAAKPNSRACWWAECRTAPTTKPPISFCAEHLTAAVQQLASPDGYRALWARSTDGYKEALPSERQLQPESKPTWVYFMRRETLIKIGYSNDPRRRASALGATLLAKVRGDVKAEAEFHRHFKHLRERGEWFHPGPDLIAAINLFRHSESLPPISADSPEQGVA